MNSLPWKTKAKGLNNDIKHLLVELRQRDKQISRYERTVRRQSIWILVLLLASIGSWMIFLWS